MFLKIVFMVLYECNFEGKFVLFFFQCLSHVFVLVSVQSYVNVSAVDFGFVWICVDL